MIWTPELDTKITDLRSLGMSCTEIARHLNTDGYPDVTRNSIAGRFHRLNGGSESTYRRKPRRVVNGVEKQAYACRTWQSRIVLPWAEWKVWNQQRRAENALR